MNLASSWSLPSKILFQIRIKCKRLLPKKRAFAFGEMSTKEKPMIGRIYVINLDRQTDRLNRLEQELKHVLDSAGKELWNLTERHAAVDAIHFSNDPQKDDSVDPIYSLRDQLFVEPQPLTLPTKIELDSPINMSRPEIAVALSHVKVWRKAKARNDEYVLILEDDVWLRPDFAHKLDQAWLEISFQINKISSFDILYLSYKEVKDGAPKTYISNNLFKPERGLWYLSGYVLSRKGAEKLLNLLPCKGPVDLWINQQFKLLDVIAIRRPIILQRKDFGSTNSYSILPSLTKIGAINSERSSLFHIHPNTFPVFAFGTNNSGLSSLAMALAMLGYRCCSDLKNLPESELQTLLNGSSNRIFNAYVNIGSLNSEIITLKELYPTAKFIITKSESESIDNDDLKVVLGLNDLDVIFLHLETKNKWQVICEHLRCAPPVCSFPQITDLGQRELLYEDEVENSLLKCRIPKRDASPWIIERNSKWRGIHTALINQQSAILKNQIHFRERLGFLDPKTWLKRDDTFTDNLALFRPSNIKFHHENGAVLTIQKEALGVREYSAAALTSCDQYLYGRFEAVIKASKAPGVVTGIFLHRDSPRQEIDIEIVGNRTNRLIVNVFYNPGSPGAKFDYGYRGTPSIIDLGFDASEDYHLYSIEWKPNEIKWFVDGRLVHKRVDWDPTPIPNLPMAFHINIWPTRSKELAGHIKSAKLPSSTYIKSIILKANHPEYSYK